MSKINIEKKNLRTRKLSLSRETLRTLNGEQLEEVAGGARTLSLFACTLGCSAACSTPC